MFPVDHVFVLDCCSNLFLSVVQSKVFKKYLYPNMSFWMAWRRPLRNVLVL